MGGRLERKVAFTTGAACGQGFLPDIDHPTREQLAEAFRATDALPVPWVQPREISYAVLFLASGEASYVTGITLPVDAGFTIK